MKRQIRFWRLGDICSKVYPTQESFDKLQILIDSVNAGRTNDIVWGPDLQVTFYTLDDSDSKDIIETKGA